MTRQRLQSRRRFLLLPPLPPGEGWGDGGLWSCYVCVAGTPPHPNPSTSHEYVGTPEGEGIRSAMTHLCVPIFVQDFDEGKRDALLAFESGADIVELRVDQSRDES